MPNPKPIANFGAIWDDAGVIWVGFGFDVTNTASADGSALINLKLDGVSKFVVLREGILYCDAIGTKDFAPRWVLVGGIGPLEMEGGMIERTDANGGGVAIVGYRQADPVADPTPNAPVFIEGSMVVFEGNPIGLVLSAPVTEDRYLIVKPTFSLAGGRLVAPLQIGPEVVYLQEESQTNTANILMVATVEDDIIGGTAPLLTLANTYPVGAQVSLSILLEENTGRQVDLTIDVDLDGVNKYSTVTSIPAEANTPAVSDANEIRTSWTSVFRSAAIGVRIRRYCRESWSSSGVMSITSHAFPWVTFLICNSKRRIPFCLTWLTAASHPTIPHGCICSVNVQAAARPALVSTAMCWISCPALATRKRIGPDSTQP